jgi:DNA topoisomerase-2
LDQDVAEVSYSDFVNKELILFSIASNTRAIPSIVDGLKPGQRKILYSCFKRNLVKEVKVAQLSGYVSEHSAYHHGEASLSGTIINMAQTYVGSNNINLLYPSGQFGTRAEQGDDAASPRYTFTNLCPITRLIFPQVDDNIVNYLDDDGQMIEPDYYLPVLPMVLVNGTSGIGTGWSTDIPNFNPRDIVTNIRHLQKGEPMEDMHPWYKAFKGTIALEGKTKTKYTVRGLIEKTGDTSLRIT